MKFMQGGVLSQMTKKEYMHEWYLKNKAHAFETMRLWRIRNREKVRETNRLSKIKNADRVKRDRIAYKLENREKVLGWQRKYANKPEIKQKRKEYIKQNRGPLNAYFKRRKLLKSHATPAWANQEEIKTIYSVAQFMTRYTGIVHHVDHIYPLKGKTVTGLHTHTNLRVIPAKLNRSKSNKLEFAIAE